MNLPEQNFDLNVLSQLTETQEFLNRMPIFSGAPAGVVKMFAYLAKKEEYVKGENIVSGDIRCDRLFLIMSGKVDIFQMVDTPEDVVKAIKGFYNKSFLKMQMKRK